MRALLYLILILSLTSCGQDSYNGRNIIQEEEAPTENSFSTRLSEVLLISGFECLGGETTQSREGTEVCRQGEWLVTVDQVNRCDEDGCTNVIVDPIVADLRRVNGTPLFEIVPVSPTNPSTENILNEVWLLNDSNDEERVIFRN